MPCVSAARCAPAAGAVGPYANYAQCGGAGGVCATTPFVKCMDEAWGVCVPSTGGQYFACDRLDQWYWQCKPATAPSPPPLAPGGRLITAQAWCNACSMHAACITQLVTSRTAGICWQLYQR
jgi:hypothetical protein